MNYCTPESWTLKQIYESLTKGYAGKKKIVIPMFQRGKRWDQNKEDTFIDSLKNNYPIGTLLFYKTVNEEQEIYTLIDGLQRGTTIKKYLGNPTAYFELSQLSENVLDSLYSMMLPEGNQEEQKIKINRIIKEYIHSINTFDDFEISELFSVLSEEFSSLLSHLKEFTELLKPTFKEIRDEYSALCSVSIPAIVYTGDENTLPYIFERINSKGVALTEYEIYSASWPSARFETKNQAIVDKVLAKYDTLNDSDYDLSGYDREKMRTTKMLNAFEYVFGFSKYICEKYESLRFYENQNTDETNPVGFQLLNACFNTSHGQIKDVHKIVTYYSNDIDLLEKAIIDSIEFVNKCISPILKFKGNTRNAKTKKLHSQFQIMSLISFVFRKKYDKDLKINENWKETQKILQENIWKYYVYDILTKYWSEGGTGKIHSVNSENRYLTKLTKGQFSSAYDNYQEDCLLRKEKKQVPDPIEKDFVIMNTIYLQTFTAMDQLSIDTFDVEHIATKAQMKKLINITQSDGLPISHIANLCYLPEFENRSKGANNFYQDNNYLIKTDAEPITVEEKLLNIELKYSFTKATDLEWMDFEYNENDSEDLTGFYFEFLENRSKAIKNKFLVSLGYDVEDGKTSKATNDTIAERKDFDDKFFRLEKIGKVVKISMEYLLRNELINENDISNLKDKKYCHDNLGCTLPVITEDSNELKDKGNNARYWVDPIIVKDKNYYICKEWYERYRKKVVPWIKSKINIDER